MFLKSTKSKGYEYLSLVESVWEEGTTRHHTLFQLGRADLLRNDPSFQRILSKLNQIMGISNGTFLPSDCSEATMKNYGYLAYAQLWEDLGIAKCLEGVFGSRIFDHLWSIFDQCDFIIKGTEA